MKNNSLLTTFFLLLLSTQVLTASRRIQVQPPKMSITQAIKYIDNLVSSITTSRANILPKSLFSRFDAQEEKKPDISKTEDAIKTVMDGLNTFKDNFGDFFEADKIKDTLQYLNDHAYDLFNTGKKSTTDSMNSLGTGLRRMDKIKSTVTVMLKGITGGADLVTGMYQKSIDIKLSNENQKKIYLVGLRSLDKTLLDALKTCGEVKDDLYQVADLMGATQTSFRSLAADFKRAADQPEGDAQKNYFGAWVKKTASNCVETCIGGFFAGIFSGFATCTVCLGTELFEAIKEENKRVQEMIPKNEEMMRKFQAAMEQMVGFAGHIGEVAKSQAEAVNAFQGELATMEIDLANQMDLIGISAVLVSRGDILKRMDDMRG